MTEFPCTIWFLDQHRGATRTAIAVSDTGQAFISITGAILRKRRAWTDGGVQWTDDPAVAEAYDLVFLEAMEARQRLRVKAIAAEFEKACARLERINERRRSWRQLPTSTPATDAGATTDTPPRTTTEATCP